MATRLLHCAAALLLLSACTHKEPQRVAVPFGPPLVNSENGDTTAFVIDLAPGQSPDDIVPAANKVFSDVRGVAMMFPDADPRSDPFHLASVHRLIVKGDGPDGGPWDDAYALRDAGGFARVEPDLPLQLVAQPDPAAAAPMACFKDEGIAPADRGWAPRDIHVAEARALTPPSGGKRLGAGVRICHPDTGWTAHEDLDDAQLDKKSGLNLISGGTDAHDPLGYHGNPGHGTGTGSVLISGGDLLPNSGTSSPGIVVGVAPKSTLVPIRAIKSVVQVFDSDVARAVNHAVTARCDVVSMSLGGRAFFGLERALKNAVQHDVVVVSAAGNCVGFVVAPASYANSIAAAATNVAHDPWEGTSKGSAVDISAPGEDVWVASASDAAGSHAAVKHGDGTSYATAEVAGAAAVWLAYFGHDRIEAAKHGRTRQAVFLNALRQSARDPCGLPQPPHDCPWKKDKYGAGILDLEQLLKFDPANNPPALAADGGDDTVAVLARMFDRPPPEVRAALTRLLGNPPDLDAKLADLGPELIDLATRSPATFRGLLGIPANPAAFSQPFPTALASVSARASRRLASQFAPTGTRPN